MKNRLTYIPIEIAEQFNDFIIKKDVQILDTIKARTHDYNTLSLIKLLYQLHKAPMNFSELYLKSNIRMKKSFLNYLRFCVNYNFISKINIGANSIYSITTKGKTMLGLFMNK